MNLETEIPVDSLQRACSNKQNDTNFFWIGQGIDFILILSFQK